MGLSFGWKSNEVRESIWKDDSALQNVPAAALEEWKRDGDASHLRPYATNGEPDVIRYRTLTLSQREVVAAQHNGEMDGAGRALILAFRIGVDFPSAPESFKVAQSNDDGTQEEVTVSRTVREKGIRMLAEPFVQYLETKHPGIVLFYGGLIFNGTFPSEPEKKASSPQSTQKQSPEAASTKPANTEPSQETAEAAA